ncbi:MAG: purine-nucleoside phosphorylase, partial [Verrucomicrobiota bacterium]|nr:purine-nucleoside phosphorylase [Verrucomicrobiota bacterium]
GLARFVEAMSVSASIPFSEVPGLPPSSVPGHAGRFVLGELGGERSFVAQGRVHLYEGYTAREVTACVRFMAALGVRRLALTNAAGTLNPEFAPGTWMMLRDHLNLTASSPLTGEPVFVDLTEVYSARLRARFSAIARAEGATLHEGVYAGLPGPQYETPAEVRMLRTLGADAVGMSTVLEAIQARALGMEVAAFSCLTNWAAGIGTERLSHAEVVEAGERAGAVFAHLLAGVLRAG